MSSLSAALSAIEAWPLADAIRRSLWAYPALEAIHIASFAAVFGSLLVLELRVFGAAPAIPLSPLARLAVPVALTAFSIAATTGLLMLISNASEIVVNTAFQIKVTLIVLAGMNARWFHRRDSLVLHDGVAKAQSLLSIMLWLGVIACGRLIAYV
ncbi:MAG TPA: hypothetical protein VM937_00425 [Burkholderiaceae bacterium]|jgi:hypothetical protein|nr:hypothetical protein [Burkholderiaceae bacterium]